MRNIPKSNLTVKPETTIDINLNNPFHTYYQQQQQQQQNNLNNEKYIKPEQQLKTDSNRDLYSVHQRDERYDDQQHHQQQQQYMTRNQYSNRKTGSQRDLDVIEHENMIIKVSFWSLFILNFFFSFFLVTILIFLIFFLHNFYNLIPNTEPGCISWRSFESNT